MRISPCPGYGGVIGRVLGTALCAGALLWPAVAAAGTIEVNAIGYTGDFGAEVEITNQAATFVQDDSPNGEKRYVARFCVRNTELQMAPDDAVDPRAFTVTDDPGEVILRLSTRHGTMPIQTQYSLYGDGALERAVMDPAHPTHRGRTRLPAEDVRSLVDLAIVYGLADIEQAELVQKLDETRQAQVETMKTAGHRSTAPSFPPADAGTDELELRLESYGPATEALSKRLRITGLRSTAQQFPEIDELQGWVKLAEAVRSHLAGREVTE